MSIQHLIDGKGVQVIVRGNYIITDRGFIDLMNQLHLFDPDVIFLISEGVLWMRFSHRCSFVGQVDERVKFSGYTWKVSQITHVLEGDTWVTCIQR